MMMMFMVGGFVCFDSADAAISANLAGIPGAKSGMVMSVAALVLLMELPMVGQLTTRIWQARYLIAFGWLADFTIPVKPREWI
jgi:DHA2 family multidrug resistance protein